MADPDRDDLTPEQRRRIEALFHEVADLPPDERQVYLDANASEPAVRIEVEALLRHLEEESDPDSAAVEAARADSDQDRIGARLGHYTLVRRLGRGGMGVVYAARDEKLGREVAVKILPSELASRPELRSRFAREARAVAALNHPNIVTIHSVEEADDEHFLTMEFLQGKRLSEVVPRQGLPLGEFFDLAVPLVDAVSAAHQQGIIHRDLKPDNVVVTDEGRIKVLDFGLAKLKAGMYTGGEVFPRTVATAEGKIMGTASYMSPEQAEGKAVDARSDIFSLGIVIYEMASGRRPFEGDSSISVISSILKDTPPPVTEVNPRLPHHLGRILRRCLAKDPARRYQTALDLRNELEALREEIDTGALEVPERDGRNTGIRLLMVALAGIAILAVVSVAYLIFRDGSTEAPPPLKPHLTQLTDLPGKEIDPTLSPDGKEFAYTGDAAGNDDIYWQKVGAGNPRNLTAGCQEDDCHPAFSPDGRRIAFRSERDGGGIYIMDVTGENVRRVTKRGYHPAWSPDGKKLAVSTEKIDWPTRFFGPSTIRVVEIDSGDSREICGKNSMQPSWSPHGHRIVYWSFKGGRSIWTVPAEGGEPALVTSETRKEKCYNWRPVWSPDGKHIYFCSDRGGTMGIYRIPVDEISGRVLGPVEAITVSHSLVALPSLSRDGRKIAHISHTLDNQILKVPFDPDNGKLTGSARTVRQGLYASKIDVSPDGNWLAYVSFLPTEDIYVIQTDGSHRNRLTDNDALQDFFDRAPRWSPDGREIAFYSSRSRWQIETVRPDGSQWRQRTKDPIYQHANPVWSPDPEAPKLAAYRTIGAGTSDKSTVIFGSTQTPTFGGARVLPPWPRADEFFVAWAWSPDGRKLAGHIMRQGLNSDPLGVAVYFMEKQSYSEMWKEANRPRWLPDSRRLLVLREKQLCVLDTESGDVRSLRMPDQPSNSWVSDLALSSDGRAIYLARWLNRCDIWLLELR
jgi:eukaryotic-like serine/threonine-protein kinase